MTSPTAPGFRFAELQKLLNAYAEAGFTFTDAPEAPGDALRSYLAAAAEHPARAEDLVAQIDDLLSTGLFSDELADDVALMPQVQPTEGRSVEESLSLIRQHVTDFLHEPALYAHQAPTTDWEWRERFPEVSHLLGAYFYQDFSYEYSSEKEALDDYIAGTPADSRTELVDQIAKLLEVASSDALLEEAANALGLGIRPPKKISLRQWLRDMAEIVAHVRGT